jgi:branched-chain amino acid transport system substrate-binding protein
MSGKKRQNFIKNFVFWGLGIVMALGCGTGIASAAEKEIPIGAIYPLTGAVADSGQRCKWAAETAADLINNAHPGITLPLAQSAGLPNLGGAKVKLITADSQGNPAMGKAEAERLINQNKIVGLLGAYNSGVSKAMSIVAERAGVPLVNGSSSSTELHKQGFKTFFRTYSYDEVETKALFDAVKEADTKLGTKNKTYAIAAMVGEYGKTMADWLEVWGKRYGYKLVERVDHKFGATDLSSSVLKLKAANPDVIFHATLLSDYLLFMKTYKEMNFLPQAIMAPCSGFQDPGLIKQGGENANYLLGTQIFYLDRIAKTPNLKYINDIYRQKSKSDLDGVVIGELEAMLVLVDAINRAGSTDGKAIIQALHKTDIKWDIDVFGGVKFTEEGQNSLVKVVISQIIDGKHLTVFPLEVASQKAIWPMPSWSARKK